MDKVLRYSVFRYSPSLISGESINLGILFSAEDGRIAQFISTQKWTRLTTFDETLDIDAVKQYFLAIKRDVEPNLFKGNELHEPFDMDAFIRYYTNEFRFSDPLNVPYDDLDRGVEEVKKIYLRFDYEKKARPTEADEMTFLRKLFRGEGIGIRNNEKVTDDFGVDVTYDIVSGNRGIKFFAFNNKDLSKAMNSIKTWAWNCEHVSGKETIIVYSCNDETMDRNAGMLNGILRILGAATTRLYKVDDAASILDEFKEAGASTGMD